jgi:hypothetical protein
MPTPLHNSIQLAIQDIFEDMVENHFLSWQQFRRLKLEVGTSEFHSHLFRLYMLIIDVAYLDFLNPYAGESKEADAALRVLGRQATATMPSYCPIWVNECRWTESLPELDRDITKWLVGIGNGVLLAIETKFYRRQNARVAGTVVFHHNTLQTRRVCILRITLIPLY